MHLLMLTERAKASTRGRDVTRLFVWYGGHLLPTSKRQPVPWRLRFISNTFSMSFLSDVLAIGQVRAFFAKVGLALTRPR